MAISIILAHPNKGSFNHAIADTAAATLRANGYQINFHDLYAEHFDPILPAGEIPKGTGLDPVVQKHCDQIASSEGIVIVHPNWWAQPPAILKGWVDRVIRQGVAYEFGTNDKGEGVPIGKLKARAAVIFNTSNTPQDREVAVFGDPLDNLWKTCIFHFCGLQRVQRRQYNVIVTSTPEQRKAWLEDVKATVSNAFAQ